MDIKQDNIVIRNAEAADAPLLGGWWRDGKVMAHAGFPNGLSITDDEIANSLSTDTDETFRRLIIEVDSLPVGEMNYRNIGSKTAEIGIKICDDSIQGKGYGSTILRIFINELFCKCGYEKIVLDTNLENKRAQYVYEKLGFRKTGIRYDSWKNQLGELQSAVDYEMTKTDYLSKAVRKITHKGTVQLETERLLLRAFTPDDANAMYRNWAGDPDVTKYLLWPTHESVDTSRQVLADWVTRYENPEFYLWAIVEKSINEPIGSISSVHQDDRIKMVHIGYCIGKNWWNKGYTSEALRRLVRFFFEDVGVNRIESRHDPRNPGSGIVMKKAGLQYEATFRQSDWNNQGVGDCAHYAILAEEYFGNNKADVTIVPYEQKYRDDMLFCYLLAKDAVNAYATDDRRKKPTLKDDLLDIEGQYINRGDVFYLAVDKNDRVVGMVGTHTESPTDMWLKRLFVKPEMKGRGIGSKLLETVEKFAADKGIKRIHTRFAPWYHEASRFYPAKGFVEADGHSTTECEHECLHHMIKTMV